MTILSIACLLFQCVLFAEIPSSNISSKTASYNGNKLYLEGDVKLDHEFGEMNADLAYLEKDDKLKDFLFSFIHLQKDVRLQFKDHGQIVCEIADLNFHTLKGQFLPKLGEKVIYTELLEELKGKKPVMLTLKSDLGEIKISKKAPDGEYQVDEVEASKNVVIEYGDEFSLKAEKAVFQGLTKKSTITAYPKNDAYCSLSHGPDLIEASLIECNIEESKLIFHNPRGKLASVLLPQIQKDDVAFQCKKLIWDHVNGFLKLTGAVEIQEGTFATLQTDDEVEFIQAQEDNKKILKTITSKGISHLKYIDRETKMAHELTCYGPIKIDREKLHATLKSPVTDGKVAEEMQINYTHEAMGIRADQADVQYKTEEKQTLLSSLSLEGNVHLSSLKKDRSERLAIADKIEFDPSSHTFTLSAKSKNKVLFWDAEDQLSISANQVKITRDPVSGKDVVRGVGHVKFAFTAVEQAFLKKVFPFYEPREMDE